MPSDRYRFPREFHALFLTYTAGASTVTAPNERSGRNRNQILVEEDSMTKTYWATDQVTRPPEKCKKQDHIFTESTQGEVSKMRCSH